MSHIQTTPLASHSNDAGLKVGIVVALPEELATLTDLRLKTGEMGQIGRAYVVCAGAGMTNAMTGASLLVKKGVDVLISWGCAAGLSAEARPGDLLLAEQVLTAQGSLPVDPILINQLTNLLPNQLSLYKGKLFTSPTLVADSQAKRNLHAHSQAFALDMESAAIAEIAQQNGLPFLAIRSIADPVEMSLPAAVSQALTENGQVSLPRLLTYLLWHPTEIPALIRLGRHFKAAQSTLKMVAQVLQHQLDWLKN